ncbi:MAG: lipoyl synthase [Acidimicrobiia bacterium]|nr:lipoyl synthase [Acidimicrobiia bacterium]
MGSSGLRRLRCRLVPPPDKGKPGDLGLGTATDLEPTLLTVEPDRQFRVAAERTRLRTRWLGRLAYDEAWDLQRAFWEGRQTGRAASDYLLLQEHPHVYTVGRNGDGSHLLIPEEGLAGIGAQRFDIDRGGDITYHGPGQLVGYPIVALADLRKIVPYVRAVEEVLIRTLSDFGVEAWRDAGYTGVWTDRGKVAAIGVRVARGVTMHGFALNVDPDMSYFGHMHPCGITDRPVTSLVELLGTSLSIEEAVEVLVPRFVEVFGYERNDLQLGPFTRGQGRPRAFEVDRLLAEGTFAPKGRAAVPVTIGKRLEGEPPRAPWMKVTARLGPEYRQLGRLMRELDLHTVCEEAGCPNIYECWSEGAATIMILGGVCTRACGFCDVTTGRPQGLDLHEPVRVAEAIATMGLRHAVITSVNRDDLPDGGSTIFARTVQEVRKRVPECDVEVLIPDFKGARADLERVLEAGPAVLNHNTETVLRLQREVRTAASYGRSLALLARAKWYRPDRVVKSGLIVGMGETREEVLGAIADLRAVGVDVVTVGQYLRPTVRHRPVHRYVPPDEFDEYARFGGRIGLAHIESGPLVRSSYHARDSLDAATTSGLPAAIGGHHS